MQAPENTSPEVLGTPIAGLVEESNGITEVAQQAGLAMPHLWMIVNGRRNPTYATRLKLARVFGCRVDEVSYPSDMEQS